MTTVVLGGLAGAILSLLFEWFPGLSGWYGKQEPIVKRGVMAVALVLASVVVFALACAGFLEAFNWTLSCDTDGLAKLMGLLFAALAVNQPFHALIKKS